MSVLSESGPGVESGDRRPGRAVLAALFLTIVGLVGSLVGGIALVVPLLVLEVDLTGTLGLIALTAAGQLGFLAVGYGYARRAGVRVKIARPTRREAGLIVGGTVFALVLVTVLSAVVETLGLIPGSVIETTGAVDRRVYLYLAVLSVVVVAPAEEFLFRGVIQTRLRRAFGPVAAVAGASLLFGSLHLANYVGSVGSVVAGGLLVTITGSVLGVLYERTGNLTVPIAAHAAYNVVLLAIAYLGAGAGA